jgi:hypothetical protein
MSPKSTLGDEATAAPADAINANATKASGLRRLQESPCGAMRDASCQPKPQPSRAETLRTESFGKGHRELRTRTDRKLA